MLPSTPFLLHSYKDFSISPPPPLTLRTTSSWSHAGAPLSPSSLPLGYQTWAHSIISSGDLTALLTPFLDYLNSWMSEMGVTHYLLTIRAQKATKEFEVPRWHIDRRAFDRPLKSGIRMSEKNERDPKENGSGVGKETSVWKIATALQGPGTLFLQDSTRGLQLQNASRGL
jgi:hypothetical protein